MATFDLGRVTPLYKGDYSASASYELNDVVLHNGNLYWHVQATATVGILPTDTTVWKLAFADEGVRAEIRGYADDAQASKSAAAQSASQASASASNASASASQAASSAQTAGTKASEASTSAQTASTKASEASASAQSAASSAQTATDKATLATNKAQAASESASLATAKASAAATSETNAVTAANTATSKASQAAASATSAREYNESAQQSAVNAQTAQGLAETAQTAAETAQGLAEDARDEAQEIVDGINAKAEQIDTNTAEITELKNDGVAPSAEQILSDKGVTDSVPYHYRRTGGNGADRLYDQIVGGSLAVNQLVNPDFSSPKVVNDVTYTKNVDGSVSVSGESTGRSNIPVNTNEYINIVQSHKYLIAGNPSGASQSTYYMALVGYTDASYAFAQYVYTDTIINNTHSTANHARLEICGASVSGVSVNVVFYPQLFDLTAMFGTTIADYVYGLETATAGAGVAWLKAHFPRIFNAGYVPYNAGELVSVQASAHKMTGFNQWDEEWEEGSLGNSGENISYQNVRSKNYIPILPNNTYYIKASTGLVLFWYDANKTFISKSDSGISIQTATPPTNAVYLRFRTVDSYGATYKNDICINLSDPAKNGTYEPYNGHTYPLDSDLELRGLPKLDADNNLVYDGDTYDADGTVTRKYGIVDLGTLTWAYDSASQEFRAGLAVAPKPNTSSETPNAICTKYIAHSHSGQSDGEFSVFYASVNGVNIMDSAYTDAATFKTAMSGVYLVYELATPTTETAEPYINPQICDPNGTEEFVSTGIVPVGHETRYPENLRAKIEGLPWDFSSLIAPTEKSTTASRNYTIGNLLIMGNALYKVTANIANGGTITPNTNVTATTLSEILSALAQ